MKKLLVPDLFNYTGTTGIFVPFTGESCVNPDTYAASLPFTMCHELAHRLTIAAEDEANFAAFLGLHRPRGRGLPLLRLVLPAFVYCYNALYEADQAAATEIWDTMSETLRADCRRANAHYEPLRGHGAGRGAAGERRLLEGLRRGGGGAVLPARWRIFSSPGISKTPPERKWLSNTGKLWYTSR